MMKNGDVSDITRKHHLDVFVTWPAASGTFNLAMFAINGDVYMLTN